MTLFLYGQQLPSLQYWLLFSYEQEKSAKANSLCNPLQNCL
jgi:hypothetical protein